MERLDTLSDQLYTSESTSTTSCMVIPWRTEAPQELIEKWNSVCAEPDEVPAFYVEDEHETLYFYYGNTRIRVAEHFNDNGKPIGTLIENVIRYSASRQAAEN